MVARKNKMIIFKRKDKNKMFFLAIYQISQFKIKKCLQTMLANKN